MSSVGGNLFIYNLKISIKTFLKREETKASLQHRISSDMRYLYYIKCSQKIIPHKWLVPINTQSNICPQKFSKGKIILGVWRRASGSKVDCFHLVKLRSSFPRHPGWRLTGFHRQSTVDAYLPLTLMPQPPSLLTQKDSHYHSNEPAGWGPDTVAYVITFLIGSH